MSEGKHTPGPWERLTFSNHELQTDFAMVRIGGRVHMIGYSDEDVANARLISAAPELLEALECLLAVVEQHDTPLSDPERIAARAAIAKAKGEA